MIKGFFIHALILLCLTSCSNYPDEVLPKGTFEVFALDNGRVAINSTLNLIENTQIRWQMGDGFRPIDETVPVASPTRYYDYKKNDTYTITLYYWGMYNDGPDTENAIWKSGYIFLDKKTIAITTSKGTAAVFSYAIDATNRLKVVFQNQSQYADQYSWKFGDGTENADPSPTHVYVKAGKYTVSLAAIRNNEADIVSQTIELK
ncbi:MAG: PKD domain-containing protein [Spirosomataceae bacterium]